MSRYHPNRENRPIYEAAAHWRQRALEQQGSVLGSGAVWTPDNVASLKRDFVQRPDEGDGTFIEKLERQLSSSGSGAKQLAAEMTWFMLLCPSNITARSKRDTIRAIWAWSGGELPNNSPWLTDTILAGIGSAGTAFNTQRWRELRFFVGLVEQLHARGSAELGALLSDGWKFAEWIEDVPDARNRQLRHMVLHLLFPDDFERIFGRSDRRKVLRAFSTLSETRIAALSPLEIDRELRSVRVAQERKYQTAELDFYEAPLSDVWQQPAPAAAEAAGVEEGSVIAAIASRVKRNHVLEAIEEIDREGIPGDARSTTYDLVQGSRRYPPEHVFALVATRATGEQFERTNFAGGGAAQCFKVLRELGFAIERRDFIPELVDKFVKQADEGTDLTVSEYAKSYRGLKVNVSFGKGNIARIPWISLTAFGQSTSDGIYPVLLYYRSIGRLVMAYGISETNAPKDRWGSSVPELTIAEAFEQQNLPSPERYGASRVHTIFDLSEGMDLERIGVALDEVIARYYVQFERERDAAAEQPVVSEPPPPTYSIEEALKGLFIEEQELGAILGRLRTKKNIILQGPPGVGKTFVCKRLAYALLGEQARDRFQMVQFHQSYSYEDFIQGFRPTGQGGFRLKNGLFHEFCALAKDDPGNKYVFAIDEINRGNLSKVFGEVMMLMEPDKRGAEWAIPLAYSESSADVFYVPENVYLIGLMNTADRSLAMVDYALMRRFSFVDLEPQFDSEQFRAHLEEKGADSAFTEMVIRRLTELNAQIAEDVTNLGPGYRIGHSYFCIGSSGLTPDWAWYKQVIEAEIAPLLRAYYFDNRKQVSALLDQLLRRE